MIIDCLWNCRWAYNLVYWGILKPFKTHKSDTYEPTNVMGWDKDIFGGLNLLPLEIVDMFSLQLPAIHFFGAFPYFDSWTDRCYWHFDCKKSEEDTEMKSNRTVTTFRLSSSITMNCMSMFRCFQIHLIYAKHMSATVLHRRSLSLAAAAVTLAMRQKRPMQMWYQFISLDDERWMKALTIRRSLHAFTGTDPVGPSRIWTLSVAFQSAMASRIKSQRIGTLFCLRVSDKSKGCEASCFCVQPLLRKTWGAVARRGLFDGMEVWCSELDILQFYAILELGIAVFMCAADLGGTMQVVCRHPWGRPFCDVTGEPGAEVARTIAEASVATKSHDTYIRTYIYILKGLRPLPPTPDSLQ